MCSTRRATKRANRARMVQRCLMIRPIPQWVQSQIKHKRLIRRLMRLTAKLMRQQQMERSLRHKQWTHLRVTRQMIKQVLLNLHRIMQQLMLIQLLQQTKAIIPLIKLKTQPLLQTPLQTPQLRTTPLFSSFSKTPLTASVALTVWITAARCPSR